SYAKGTWTPSSGAEPNSDRLAAVYFPSNVQVTAGSSTLSSAKFRVTEYTVGANGKDRMPANVADNTMYTYASEFTLEDNAGNLYDSVKFSPPVFSYVINF